MGMKMAKASRADLDMAMELGNALEAISWRWGGVMPEKIEKLTGDRETENFDIDDHEHCRRVLEYLIKLVRSASLMRVTFGMTILLDPRNRIVDPEADTLEHHPDSKAGQAARQARPLAEWHEDMGAVLWWRFPVEEAPWCGTPNSDGWPHYHTHWTPLVVPAAPAAEAASV